MKKSIITFTILTFAILGNLGAVMASNPQDESGPEEQTGEENSRPSYLQAVIKAEEAAEIEKNIILDASQSFIPDPESEITYNWDFGDGNKNEGVEILHSYDEPGEYTVTLTINDGENSSKTTYTIFAYRKLITLITDQIEAKERIQAIQSYAKSRGVFMKVIESFRSSTEFISEEVLAKKLTEESASLQKSSQIVIWTKENAGLNALSRFIQSNQEDSPINFSQKQIVVLGNNISANTTRIQRQFDLINPQSIIVTKEGAIYPVIESDQEKGVIENMEEEGHEYTVIDSQTGKLRPWNFMTYFVNFLISSGVPDNTIALLLLLPVIATVVAIMKQVVGITTFGIYTPSIITLSFLVIGIEAGLITLIAAIAIGSLSRPFLKKVRMLFIPKMAIVMTIVSLALFLILILSLYLSLFDAAFLSIAIFPMLILSTLVEKFVSVKTEKGLSSAIVLMTETVIVSIVAYFIVGGSINLGFVTLKMDFIKILMISHPEIIFLLLILNVFLGKWSGLRLLEAVRFREILRHIEE